MNLKTPLDFKSALPWAIFVTTLFWLNYMSRSALSPLLVYFETDLKIGHSSSTSVMLLQSIGFAISLFVSGFLLSKIKPRTMVGTSLILSSLPLLFMPWVEHINQARLLFFCLGLGAGLYFTAGIATLSDLVYPKDWGKAVAVHELAPNLGFICIPLIVQFFLMFTDWKGSFVGMGCLMFTAGVSFLIWGQGGRTHCSPISFAGCKYLLKNPASWAVLILMSSTIMGEFSIFSVLQLFLVNELKFSPDTANVLLTVSRLATPVAVMAGGYAADHFNPLVILRTCLTIQAVALGAMAMPQLYLIIGGIIVQAICIAFVFPSLFKAYTPIFKTDEQPILLSLSMPLACVFALGIVPFFLGICGEYLSFKIGFIIVAVISLASVLAVQYLKPKA